MKPHESRAGATMGTQITLKRQELNEVKASSSEIFRFGSLRSGGYMMKRLHDNPELPFHSQRCHRCELCSLMMPIRPKQILCCRRCGTTKSFCFTKQDVRSENPRKDIYADWTQLKDAQLTGDHSPARHWPQGLKQADVSGGRGRWAHCDSSATPPWASLQLT